MAEQTVELLTEDHGCQLNNARQLAQQRSLPLHLVGWFTRHKQRVSGGREGYVNSTCDP